MASGKTYTGDPAGRPIDAVRLELGEQDCATARLSDAEIEWLLGREGSPLCAAAAGAELLAALYARDVSYSAGDQSKELSDRSRHYTDLAKRLKARCGELVSMVSTGQGVDAKIADATDPSLVQPSFRRDQFANPRR